MFWGICIYLFAYYEASYIDVLCFCVAVVGTGGGGVGIPLAAGSYQGQNPSTYHLTCKKKKSYLGVLSQTVDIRFGGNTRYEKHEYSLFPFSR